MTETRHLRRKGWLEEPRHNTYDVEFWGPNGVCASFYLGALRAAILTGQALGLYLQPRVAGDFRSFLSTATGYGTVGIKNGEPFFDVVSGAIEVREIRMG